MSISKLPTVFTSIFFRSQDNAHCSKAAELESPKAMVRLGHMYFHGSGLAGPNYEEALKNYREAMRFGSAEAMTNLGFPFRCMYLCTLALCT